MKQEIPFFVTITSEVLRDKDLNPIEKLIFTEIMALTYSCGYCYASNSHFAEIFDRTLETISRNISKLQSKGYIYTEININDGNSRKIYVKYTGNFPMSKTSRPIDENVKTSCQKHQDPLDENVKHSNTLSKSFSKSTKKEPASGFSSQSNRQENLDSAVSAKNSHTQFQEFWNLYEQPQKVIDWNKPNIARQKAFSKFQARLKEMSFEELMQNTRDYLQYKKVETSGTAKVGVDVFLNGKCQEDYQSKTKVILQKQGKPLPVQQKSPEKQQEEVKMKEDTQKKREDALRRLNGDEVQFMNYIKEVLKSNYDVKFHEPWIDDFVFSCRNKVAYFGFTEQKHIDTVKLNFVKFEQIIMREITTTELVQEGDNLKIELKLID